MDNTIVTKEVVDLDIFPGINSDDIITSESGNNESVVKKNIFSTDSALDFLDTVQDLDTVNNEENATPKKPSAVIEKEGQEILGQLDKDLSDVESDEDDNVTTTSGNGGKTKTDKSALTSYLKSKIESKEFFPFDDWDEKKQTLDEYLASQPEKSLHDLLDLNWQEKEKAILEKTPVEFFESLPEEMQYAARYVMEGGTDLKGMFAALARVEEVKNLDVDTQDGQILIARTYLQTTEFGTPEEIEEEIQNWIENDRIEKKAKSFKPRLDELQKEQVEYQLAQQQEFNKRQQEAANMYISNVQKALQPGEINGIKLDKKTQMFLHEGLTTAKYPSVSGKPTNLLGHLLDKIQYVEPNYALLAEVTYLLSDPEGYKKTIRQQEKNAVVTETVKRLKSEHMNNSAGFSATMGDDSETKTKKLIKPRNIFQK